MMSRLDEIIERLIRIEERLSSYEKYCSGHRNRTAALEKTVNGNGKIGLAEEVRLLKGKWAMAVAAASVFIGYITQKMVNHFIR